MEIIESEAARDYNYFLEDSGLTPKITVDN